MDTLKGFSTRCLSSGQVANVQSFAATKAVTIDLTGEVRASIRATAPGGVVKGRGGKPARIGAGYRLDSTRRSGLVFARGPLQFIERDTKAHPEPKVVTDVARQARTRAQRRTKSGRFVRKGTAGGLLLAPQLRKKALLIPGIGFRRKVKHPGTHGQHPFMNSVNEYRASGKAAAIYARQTRAMLREIAR